MTVWIVSWCIGNSIGGEPLYEQMVCVDEVIADAYIERWLNEDATKYEAPVVTTLTIAVSPPPVLSIEDLNACDVMEAYHHDAVEAGVQLPAGVPF